ncbi:hypothetical protein LZ554_002871 [Drepanopeziza brunnea f. sp. 'monogermtubi']|nr:hypothetical protein LZ554_002871 [Drepanopeziza brunnea f. sp. 'monogermtubi']
MRFTDAIVAVAVFTASAAAAPSLLKPRQSGTMKLCKEANFIDCTEHAYQAKTCYEITDFASEYNDAVTSFDTGGPMCIFYVEAECQLSGTAFRWDGSFDDLVKHAPEFDNAFSSYKCDSET